jgi:hypothetical protein
MCRDPASIAAWFASTFATAAPAAAGAGTAASLTGGTIAFSEAVAAGASGMSLVAPAATSPGLFSSLVSGIGAAAAHPAFVGATMLGGTALNAAGTMAQSNALSKSLEMQSSIFAADAAARQAEAEREATVLEREGSRLRGSQRALLAGSGVRLDAGTPLLLDADLTAEVGRRAAELRSLGTTDASRLMSMSRLRGIEASGARRAGRLGSVSSLLTGGAELGISIGRLRGVR